MSRLVPAVTGLATAAAVAWQMRDQDTNGNEDQAEPVLSLGVGEGVIVGDIKVKVRQFELANLALKLLITRR